MQLEVNIARKAFTNAAGERHDVLADFNFALGSGEVGVFVGPSGCGKSTMLKIVAGLDHGYQGGVAYPAGARIGMVFQEPRLLPWRSVDDNVRLAAPKADDEKLSALFAVLELTAHRNHFPGELSLGLARRAALARAQGVHKRCRREARRTRRFQLCAWLWRGWRIRWPIRLRQEIDTDAWAVTKTIKVGQRPRGIEFTRDGKFVLVAVGDDDTIQVIDAATHQVVAGLDHGYQGGVAYPAGARIGMVFQEPRLLPWRSVDDNVRLAAPKADDEKLSALFAWRSLVPAVAPTGTDSRRTTYPTC